MSRKEPKDSKDKQASRRKITRQILVGGGVIGGVGMSDGRWVKPILKETILPSHAEMTPLTCPSTM